MSPPSRLRTTLARWAPPLAGWTFVWLVLSAMLYLLLANELQAAPNLGEVLRGQAVRVLLWIATAFAVQALWRRFPLEVGTRWLPALAVHAVAGVAAMLFNYFARVALFRGGSQLLAIFDQPMLGLGATNLWDFVIYWGVIAYTVVTETRERELEVLRHQAQLQSSIASAELRALKYQLQPHFLYNALNAVVALIRNERYEQAAETLASLGTVLRALTDGPSREFVRLDEELMFLEKLLSIEQVRFGEKLRYTLDAPPALHDASVPSFILQPLIENAVKHGISRLLGPGRIVVRASTVAGGSRLRLEVVNDVPPPAPSAEAPDQLLSGVGLSATRNRLRYHYNGEGEMRCDLFSGSPVTVSLEFPLTRISCP